VPELPRQNVALTLYLIGDAGDPDSTGEPVLNSLDRELASGGSDRVVLFLGDNIYPKGLPRPDAPDRAEAERRINAQLNAVAKTGAIGYFVLGNHDWARFGKDGWNAARRQDVYVDSAGRGRIVLLPGNGCPGPAVVDVASRVRLVLLDTQWWLHTGPKPVDLNSGCAAAADDQIVDSIRSAIRGAGGKLVVVAGHHPIETGGLHGGHFGWKDHLFPLTNFKSWLWLPLPVIGSAYPAARQHGISNQDMGSYAYQHFIGVLSRAFEGRPPALYAAGHDHNLQVIAGGPAKLQVVSGGGIYGHTEHVAPIRGTLFAREASGYSRLDIPPIGRARLAVVEVNRTGESHEVFSTWVE
jgi:hypothetical protein